MPGVAMTEAAFISQEAATPAVSRQAISLMPSPLKSWVAVITALTARPVKAAVTTRWAGSAWGLKFAPFPGPTSAALGSQFQNRTPVSVPLPLLVQASKNAA